MPKDIDKEFLDLRKAVMEKEFSRMNDRQREAVLTTKGPLLVLAGAGSGKTTVLVNRVACILKYGDAYLSDAVPPRITAQDIEYIRSCLDSGDFDGDRLRGLLAADPPPAWGVLAITFTNKAANEMKERLAKMLGEQAKDIWALTFHSACARMLRRDIESLGLGYTRSFTIYDTDDSVRLLRDTCRDIAGDDRGFITKTLLPSIKPRQREQSRPQSLRARSRQRFPPQESIAGLLPLSGCSAQGKRA
jgi:DNA helicase-2/ATP-dependent DNA helicase PcrA